MAGHPSVRVPDTSLLPVVLAACWALDGIAIIAVGLRFLACWRVLRRVTLADYLMAAALVFGLAQTGVMTAAGPSGLGRHLVYLKLDQISALIRWLVILLCLAHTAATLGRLSITCYDLYLFKVDRFKCYVLYACIWANVLPNLVMVIILLAACGDHITNIWSLKPNRHCLSDGVQVGFSYFQCVCNTILDLVLALIPAWLVWHMHLSRNIKIGLTFLMSLSLLAACASILKITKVNFILDPDTSYNFALYALYSGVEKDVIIIVGSVPVIKPLFGPKKRTTTDSPHRPYVTDYKKGLRSPGYTRRDPKGIAYSSHNETEAPGLEMEDRSLVSTA